MRCKPVLEKRIGVQNAGPNPAKAPRAFVKGWMDTYEVCRFFAEYFLLNYSIYDEVSDG